MSSTAKKYQKLIIKLQILLFHIRAKIFFYCEVKNLQKFDIFNEGNYDESTELFGKFGADPIYNSLTKHIHVAAKQLQTPTEKLFNVIAFYNENDMCDFGDLKAVKTGNFYSEDEKIYPVYKKYSEGNMKKDMEFIDLIIWLHEGKPEKFLFNFQNGVERLKRLCSVFKLELIYIKPL